MIDVFTDPEFIVLDYQGHLITRVMKESCSMDATLVNATCIAVQGRSSASVRLQ
jgi:hypothetical protein